MNILYVLLSAIVIFTSYVENSKILGVFPTCAHSHFSVGFRLMKELADRGHQVTFINCYPQKTPIKNLRDVGVEGIREFFEGMRKDLLNMESQSPLAIAELCLHMGNLLTDKTLSSPQVQKLLASGETFDLVITEEFMSPGLLGLAPHFKAPSILANSLRASIWSNYYFGNPEEPSYIPHIHAEFTTPMSFSERFWNGLHFLLEYVVRHARFLPAQNEILHKYLPHVPHLNDIIYNQTIMLVNSHSSFNNPVPQVPGIIEVGGYHVARPKPLPKDLQEFLDNANEGVIYFSLGSNLQSKDFTPEKINAVMGTFSKLKQKVIWKFENDTLPNKPANVFIGKWFPQNDILAHPNVRAFVSHGGLLGSIEAVYHGVPIVGIPFYGDQKSNIQLASSRGYALALPYSELTEETFTAVLTEILNNPKYTENVKWRSKLLHDRPMSPIDTAVYWVEYVIRHGGATHFRSAALDLAWYQRYMFDVIMVVIAITVAVVYVLKNITKALLLRKTTVTEVKKNL